ncbi:MAG TPA: hypothetical protein VG758_09870 [Hyphomicrobiaceae bacterium]|nr:hypothetical protein [Hyphomicrobiaceae bacterium]
MAVSTVAIGNGALRYAMRGIEVGCFSGLLVAAATSSAAQEQLSRFAYAKAESWTRLSLVAVITDECTVGPTPDIRLVAPPSHGTFVVRKATLKPSGLRRCPDLQVPVHVIAYRPRSGFRGIDEVVFSITRHDGRQQIVTTRIIAGADEQPETGPR